MAIIVGVLGAVACLSAATAIFSRRDGLVFSRLGIGLADSVDGAAPARPLVARLGALRCVPPVSAGSVKHLAASGWALTADELKGWKVLGAVSAGALAFLLPPPGLALFPLLALLAFRAPDMVLARAAESRRREIDAEVPQLLDLLAAGSSAGLAAPLALSRAAGAIRGPLAQELRSSLRAVDLGRRWREELASMADRVGLPDLRRTVGALARTEMLGASLADTVSDLASQVRASRASATAERARKAPVKMLFPLVFLVLPAFLLLTVVPVLLSTIRSIS